MQRVNYRAIVSALALILMALAFIWHSKDTLSLDEIANSSTQVISKRAKESEILAQKTILNLTQVAPWQGVEGFGIYVFLRDSLILWNNSELPLEGDLKYLGKPTGVSWLESGTYLYATTKNDSIKCIVVSLIKPSFGVKNKYLSNDFKKWTGIPTGIQAINPAKNPSGVAFIDYNQQQVIALKGTENNYGSPETAWWCTMLFLCGVLLFLLMWLTSASKANSIESIGVTLLLIGLRWAMLFFHVPDFLYEGPLYDVRYYGNAQSFFNGYLGDILLNAVLLLTIVIFWTIVNVKMRASFKSALACIFFVIALVSFYATCKTLITNSTLNFDFLGIFNVSPLAFVGLAAICLFSITLLITLYVLYEQTRDLKRSVWWQIVLVLVGVGLASFLGISTLAHKIWFLGYALIMGMVFRLLKHRGLIAALHMLIMSLITAQLLTSSIESNLRNEMEVMADKLSETKDQVLESEYKLTQSQILNDESIRNLLSIMPETAPAISSLLSQKYFNGYFSRYQIEYALFDENCHAQLTASQPVFLNEGFFEDQIRNFGDSTQAKDFFYIRDNVRNDHYIGRIALENYRLYVYLTPKEIGEAGSFPDLLLDQSQQRHDKIRRLSYGVYRASILAEAYGAYDYPNYLSDSIRMASTDVVHHYFKPDENTQVVISTVKPSFAADFTFNSYVLLFYSLIIWTGYLIYAALFTQTFRVSSFTRRVQFTIIVLLLLAITAVAVTSSRLVNQQFEEDNRKQLREKTAFIIEELKISGQLKHLFDIQQHDFVNLQLSGLSRLFRTDISLFAKNGKLFNTSQPRLYSLGLASGLANPNALALLSNGAMPAVTVEERAGTLKYLSHYTAIHDQQGVLQGYINLPYFAKQNDLVNELSGIISAFINVYVILFVLSLLAGLVLSSYITRPLRYIQQQLARISLAGSNEKIEWQTRDEVGQLVQEYNRMLVKLEESATLLARSERESAWREMAKQVAHEIRNPLTPMKLNLQYLQHLAERDPEVFRERFDKVSAGIIEQIDALATIASEFSSLARLPGTTLTKVNLLESIESAVSLWMEGDKSIEINVPPSIEVMGDREQCLRVFNNVVKNAVQATEGLAAPKIIIRVHAEDDHSVIILIRDNGCGIEDEVAGKIFTPNFTTKTTGSGLGLAMVKNIMEAFGGSIRFASKKDQGTDFYIEFRKARMV